MPLATPNQATCQSWSSSWISSAFCEAGVAEFLLLRPDAGALQPVDGDVAVLPYELGELFGRHGRQHTEVGQAAQQDGQEGLD